MEIHTSSHILYTNQNSFSGKLPTFQAQTEVDRSQQKENNRVSESDQSTQTNNEHKNLADGKAVQQAQQALDEAEVKEVAKLKQRDIEVRAHEAAHLAAAGQYATGGASFEYKRGPDGKSYAVGGEVGIDTSAIPNDPEATLRKAQQIQAAAHAPANPSAQDRQVAAQAAAMAAEARAEISEQRIENDGSTSTTIGNPNGGANQENESSASGSASAEENANPSTNNNTQNSQASKAYASVAHFAEDQSKSLFEQFA